MSAFHDDPLAKESVLRAFSQHYTGRLTVVHGDFSTRNLLLQPYQESKQDDINLALVDWELCRYGCITKDLASMVSCLYIQWQFEDTPSAEFMLRAFIRGYGHVSEELVFQMAGVIAILIVIWEKFGIIIGDMTDARVREVHQHANEFFVGAAQRDAKWLSQSILSGFLKD
ncbi:phosphotransferase family protein [Aspergillus melleus]|uniref:phosphotransferase family protein n=1 Tax=Aspergillus melleus TaxID=138277 RepID=UPI001E8EA348|nr:uncharacterized protein LDX57_008391 [Aspergillus melleus]KAH8430728.1 hypothetical protein LDX57_008391 [Aspergillus melleus]